MTETPADENTPAEGITYGLTAEEAARRVGMTLNYFRTTMTKLNNSGQDLRSPVQPGERARKYDPKKLDAWKTAGCPVPKDTHSIPKPKPGAREIIATATRQRSAWIIDIPEINQGTRTENLRNARRIAHAIAADKLGLAPNELTVNLSVNIPANAAEKWEQAKAQEKEAREATALAAQLSRLAVNELKAQGCTLQDIGDMLGITPQRAQQLSQ